MCLDRVITEISALSAAQHNEEDKSFWSGALLLGTNTHAHAQPPSSGVPVQLQRKFIYFKKAVKKKNRPAEERDRLRAIDTGPIEMERLTASLTQTARGPWWFQFMPDRALVS